MNSIILVLFYLAMPALIMLLIRKVKILKHLGPVIIAYVIGLLMGNTGILPENASNIQDNLNTVLIPLAIPLLLLSLNVRNWFKMAGKTFLSLVLGIFSVIIPVILGYIWFGENIEENYKVGGMLVGVYTGGTPNLASIATALNVNPETYVLAHTYDLIGGVIFLLIVMTFAKKLFLLFLPPYKAVGVFDENVEEMNEDYIKIFNRKNFKPLLWSLGIGIIIFAIGASSTFLVPEKNQMMVVILLITTLAIIASLFPFINKLKVSFDFGMYLIVTFSLVVASMADISKFDFSSPNLFYYVLLVEIGSIFIHALLSAFFKVDADNVIVVSTALACSPPFVPVVAGALKNKEIILAGITVGIIGYAIGNYLGISMSLILQNFPF